MFTSIDKALIAIVAGVIYFANTLGFAVPAEWVATINSGIVAITPILVWLMPNKATR
jgi:hypothetical protein